MITRGIVFVGDPEIEAVDAQRTPPPDAPRFAATDLDASLLGDCFRVIAGAHPLSRFESGVSLVRARRIRIHGPVRSAIHLYACSDDFCRELAALTEERAAEVAHNWNPELRVTIAHQPPSRRPDHLLGVLLALAELARKATAAHKRVLLRVEYG